ncbi:MAG: terminase small subunit [Ignavibacteriales bacterium]
MGALTRKQELFVKEYLIDLNATQAAIRAGYSKRNADKIGPELLQKPQIQAAIQAAMKEREARTEVTQDMVLQHLRKIAFGDLKDFVKFGPDGVEIKDCEEVDGTVLAEVSESKTEKSTNVRVKMPDKLKALELLGRHLGMFRDKVEYTGKDGGPLEIASRVSDMSDEELTALITHTLEEEGYRIEKIGGGQSG